jgi:hypothetical protein
VSPRRPASPRLPPHRPVYRVKEEVPPELRATTDLGLVPSPAQLVIIADNLRPGGAIRGISGTLGREGRGECCGYSEVFYVVAPTCLG